MDGVENNPTRSDAANRRRHGAQMRNPVQSCATIDREAPDTFRRPQAASGFD
jgi:hypothetical protein